MSPESVQRFRDNDMHKNKNLKHAASSLFHATCFSGRSVLSGLTQYKTGRSDSGCRHNGASPSGKAAVFGTAIPRFESWRPSQISLKFGLFCRLPPSTGLNILRVPAKDAPM